MKTRENHSCRPLINEYREKIKGNIDRGIDEFEMIKIKKIVASLYDDYDERIESAIRHAYEYGFMIAWTKENQNHQDPDQHHGQAGS